jgi:four helix bundle protein
VLRAQGEIVAGVERFEDLIAWQKARVLTRQIYAVTKLKAFAADYALVDQMRRASVSIMSNIAEGFERSRPGEFHQFLSTAKGSCAELRSHLYVSLDAGHLLEPRFEELLIAAEEVGRVTGGLRVAVERQKARRI